MFASCRRQPPRHPEHREGQVRKDRLSPSNSFAVIPSKARGFAEEVVRMHSAVSSLIVGDAPVLTLNRLLLKGHLA